MSVPNVVFRGGTVNINGTYDVSDSTSLLSTANFNPGATVENVGNTLTINSNGIANFNTGNPITTVIFIMAGGKLTGTSDITVEFLGWTGGLMSGSGHTIINLEAAITGSAVKSLSGRILDNTGTLNWIEGDISADNGGVINNLPGAIFDVQGNMTVSAPISGTFNNEGTFRKSAGTGTTNLGIVFNNNNAWVDIQAGTLSLGHGGTSSGRFTGATETTLEFASRPYTLEQGSSVTVPNVVFSAGTNINRNSTYNVADSTTVSANPVNFNTGANVVSVGKTLTINGYVKFDVPITVTTLNFNNGSLSGSDDVSVTGVLTWTYGTMSGTGRTNISSTGKLIISNMTLLQRTINNAGTAIWSGTGNMYMSDGAVFNNLENALFEVQNDRAVPPWNIGPDAIFNNVGTFRKSGGSGTTDIDNAVFNNSGLVDIQTGTLSLGHGGTATGIFQGATGTALQFAGRSYTLESNSSVNVPNVVFSAGTNINRNSTYNVADSTTVSANPVNFNTGANVVSVGKTLTINGYVKFDVPITVTTLNFNNGSLSGSDDVSVTGVLTWTYGTMSGTGRTIANGSLVLNGPNYVLIGRTLENNGTATWSSGLISSWNGGSVRNTAKGTFDVTGDTSFIWCKQENNEEGAYCLLIGDQPTFVNAGVLTKTGAGTMHLKRNTSPSSGTVAFINSGTVDVRSGSMDFGGDDTSGYTQTNGLIRLNGGSISGAPIRIQHGGLSGSGTITGTLINASQVNPGASLGSLSIIGNYTQEITGTLNIELGGTNVGTEYDQLNITGIATLKGTLNVSTINGFMPAVGNSFQPVNFGSRSGSFTTGLDLGNGRSYTVNYNLNNLTLSVIK